jgi:hypothetical protein
VPARAQDVATMLDTAHPGGEELLRGWTHARGEEILSPAPATGTCSVMDCRDAVHVVRPARRVMVEVVASHHVTRVPGGSSGEIVVPAQRSKPVLASLSIVEATDRSHEVREVLRCAARAGTSICCRLRRKAALSACEGRKSCCQGEDDRAQCDCEEPFGFHTVCIEANGPREHPSTRGGEGRFCSSPRCGRALPQPGGQAQAVRALGGPNVLLRRAGDSPAPRDQVTRPEACNPSRTTADLARRGRPWRS